MPIRTQSLPRPDLAPSSRLLPRVLQLVALVAAAASVPALAMLTGRALAGQAYATLPVLALAALGLGVMLWQVLALAGLLARGLALTPAAARALALISLATLGLGALRALGGGWLAREIGLTSARLSSPPGLPDLFLLILCGVVLCAAQGMAAAARLAEDDAHIL